MHKVSSCRRIPRVDPRPNPQIRFLNICYESIYLTKPHLKTTLESIKSVGAIASGPKQNVMALPMSAAQFLIFS